MSKHAPSTETGTGKRRQRSTVRAVMRRVPQQDRGQRRVERILEAAAAEIAAVGVDAATTNAIAARAQTSVGSLYQFFPNKEAILQTLAARYIAELRAVSEAVISTVSAELPLPETINRIITPLAEFHERNPAYLHVYHALNRPNSPHAGNVELAEWVIKRVRTLLAGRMPGLPLEQLSLHARITVVVTHALLRDAARSSPDERPGIIREIKRLLTRYLEPLEAVAAGPR